MSNKVGPLNVFVASTPLQLISCSEAREHYGCDGNRCILILARPDNRETQSQMTYLADSLGWRGHQTWFLGKTSFYLKFLLIFRQLSRRSISYLFIGNKNSWVHEAFYLGLESQRVVFVDDGLATVKYYHSVLARRFQMRMSAGKKRTLAALGVRLTQFRDRNSLAFFTCFPLDSAGPISVQVHDFPVFRRVFKSGEKTRDGGPVVAFLGQPFGGEDRLNQLKAQIELVIERHREARIHYFMHRKETVEELERTLARFPVEIRQAGRPIEVEVALSGEQYEGFYSFASTALFTLKKIFPESLVYQLDDRMLASKLPYYVEIVDMLRSTGVETIPLAQPVNLG